MKPAVTAINIVLKEFESRSVSTVTQEVGGGGGGGVGWGVLRYVSEVQSFFQIFRG